MQLSSNFILLFIFLIFLWRDLILVSQTFATTMAADNTYHGIKLHDVFTLTIEYVCASGMFSEE